MSEVEKRHWFLVGHTHKRREVSGSGSFSYSTPDNGQKINLTKSDLKILTDKSRELCGLINDEHLDCVVISVSFLGTMTKDEFNDVESCMEVNHG